MAIGKAIQSLVAGEQVAGSKIGGKLLEELLSEGLLVVVARGSRKSYRARDIETLKRFLTDRDESYRVLEVENAETRAAMANKTGNSKLVTVRSCPGFPINCYEPIACLLNGEPFVVNPHEGSFLFVTQWESFKIPADVIVIGIENMENFRLVRKQKKFFENYLRAHALPNKTLFVSRYPQSNDLRKWLTTIPNRYLHFGDFDLAGIHLNKPTEIVPNGIKGKISRTCEDLDLLKDMKKNSNYVFLRRIFSCAGNADKPSSFSVKQLEDAADKGLIDKRVYALGGIDVDNVRMAKELGFGGVVVCSDLWKRFDIHNGTDFRDLLAHFRNFQKIVG